jgi:hypothetical protein
MRRMAFVLLCLLALGFGSCRRVSPPSPESGTNAVNIPAEAGQPVDLSQTLMDMVPKSQAEFNQPLDASWAAGILKRTLSSIPAAEILGQQLIDDLAAAIGEFQEDLSTSSSGGSGHLAFLAKPVHNQNKGDGFQAQKPFDQDGFSGDISMNFSAEIQGDRVVINIQFSTQLQGTATDKIGQALEISYSLQGDQDACPTAEGKSMGTFSGRTHAYTRGADTSYGRTTTGILDMEAYNADDGTLERGDLSFEGSANFEVDGHSWSNTYSSQAQTDNIKDLEAIFSELVANLDGDLVAPAGQVRAKVTDNVLGKAILDSVGISLVPMMAGNAMAEKNWQTDNKCVEINVTPEELSVAPGESDSVEVEVTLKADGGSVAADLEAEAQGEGGQISPKKASSSPGATANFTYTAPDDGPPGSFSLKATSKAGKAYKEVNVKFPKIEWSGTFTMAGSSNIQDVGSSQGTTTFTIRFQADLNQSGSEGGELIPFELESDASMSWSGTATALGMNQSFSGSTSNIITPNYSNPEWVSALPDGDCLAGEGYIDFSAKKLYLFLLGIGDKTGYGTFNLSPNTTCSYYHDQTTNRVYLVFPLDDEYKIADGSCGDSISANTGGQGGMKIQSTRSWHFDTRYVSDTQAGP